jgi:hypothetical protein
MNDLVPSDPDSARLIAEVANEAIKAGFGQWLSRAIGTPVENFIGLIGGDWFAHARIRNLCRLEERTKRILEDRKIKQPEEVSPDLLRPLLEGAADQNDDTLQALWAQLLAAAMDPQRKRFVRKQFVETLKQFNPIDALVLSYAYRTPVTIGDNVKLAGVAAQLKSDETEITVSLSNLVSLDCLTRFDRQAHSSPGDRVIYPHTPYGRLLTHALS